jgi:undecaprenyl-diphosphatase
MSSHRHAPAGPPDTGPEQHHGLRGALAAALYSTVRIIRRHAPGWTGAVVALLLLTAVFGAATLLLLAAVSATADLQAVHALDVRMLRWFEANRAPLPDRVMLEVTRLGDGIVLILLAIVAARFLWLARQRAAALIILAAATGGQAANTLLKLVFARPRPDMIEAITAVSSPSFPSGHAMTAFVTYSTLAWALILLDPRRRSRRLVIGIAAAVILLVGMSRAWLGVHFASDVLAGFLAGAAWLGLIAGAALTIAAFAERNPAERNPAARNQPKRNPPP